MNRSLRCLFVFAGAVAMLVGCTDHRIIEPSAVAGVDEVIAGVPIGWHGVPATTFAVGVDRTTRHGGAASLSIRGNSPSASATFVLEQNFGAVPYRGKRVRWSAWVQHTDLVGPQIGIFMNILSPLKVTEEDDMINRSLTGTASWRQISVVLDVAPDAQGIEAGAFMIGSGLLLVDDVKFEVVGTDVPVTNLLTTPVATTLDSAGLAQRVGPYGSVPVNLDFEGLAATPASAIDWVTRTGAPLTTTDPRANLADLAPLEQMVGGAHLVGLGEGTHGTREFFQMKHRIVQTLVRDLGFTVFAIEATSPEANDMNRYVLTGQGDPKILLSKLYFWTWNTQEVLDMVEWMRQWNASVPAAQRVQFLGFDMQSPGTAMDSVQAFATRVHQPDSLYVALRFNCIAPYRNHGQNQSNVPPGLYLGVSAADRAACAAGLNEVYDLIAADITRYPSAASPETFQLRVHDARLVQEFESMIAATGSRDQYMAENIGWIRQQAGSNAKVVLWAHNGHINNVSPYMGSYLRTSYGTDYVSLGMLFGAGSFNAVTLGGGPLKPWNATFVPAGSMEAVFEATGKSGMVLDMRQIASGGSAAAPLTGPLEMRSIGSSFTTAAEGTFFFPQTFPHDFDVLLYVQSTTASTLLPFIFN